MKESLIDALEASWELNPVLMEDILWKTIDENKKKDIVYNCAQETKA